MKISLCFLLLIACGCASTPMRYANPTYRVMLDPESIRDEALYAEIQTALHASGKWIVVDRANGLRAVVKEQNRLYGESTRRFGDKDKYALYGRLYGVGSVIVPMERCMNENSMGGRFIRCKQYLQAIDSITGEVIAAVANVSDGEHDMLPPGWNGTVEKLAEAFPDKIVHELADVQSESMTFSAAMKKLSDEKKIQEEME
jgi:hypothetical protein